VEEVALSGEVHGDSGCLGCRDNLVITHRTARLNHGLYARVNQNLKTIGEWEECV
jgi:hypothetical protein